MSAPQPLTRELLLGEFPLPDHSGDRDKNDRGALLVIAGSREVAGASLLAGIGGLRAGAGKLQIATAECVAPMLSIAVPEARVSGWAEDDEGCFAAGAIDDLIGWSEAAAAIVLGCGMQQGDGLDRLLDALLDRALPVPLVIDAAAIGSLPRHAEAVRGWPGKATVLPHAGEMARLIERDEDDVVADPLGAAKTAAARFDVVALMKGPVSHIAAPDGRAFRYEGGGIGLATSGSGDTLAGIVGGLAARGADPLTATLWGVYLHGEAGRRLSERVGRLGFLAREILDEVPRLLP